MVYIHITFFMHFLVYTCPRFSYGSYFLCSQSHGTYLIVQTECVLATWMWIGKWMRMNGIDLIWGSHPPRRREKGEKRIWEEKVRKFDLISSMMKCYVLQA